MKRHVTVDEFDPFDDPLTDIDGFDGFILEDEDCEPESTWYHGTVEECVFCDWGIGDADGLCIKHKYGCSIEGCEYADRNW